jgi:L-ascorbate metabolism protein UlaG (beta-lactamase superfamily)
MRFLKYAHSCVRIESDGAVMVIDPGAFTEAESLDGVDAVLITHEHGDHLDVDKLADALAKRPAVRVFTHPEVVPKLSALDGVVTEVNSGETFEAAGMRVTAHGGLHAEIHPDFPRVANLGFLVEGALYHPGDSFDLPTGVGQLDAVFVPISAPWLKLSESVDFLRALKPRNAYALHDCLLSDIGFMVTDGMVSSLAGCDYTRLGSGEAVTLPS